MQPSLGLPRVVLFRYRGLGLTNYSSISLGLECQLVGIPRKGMRLSNPLSHDYPSHERSLKLREMTEEANLYKYTQGSAPGHK